MISGKAWLPWQLKRHTAVGRIYKPNSAEGINQREYANVGPKRAAEKEIESNIVGVLNDINLAHSWHDLALNSGIVKKRASFLSDS